MDIQEGGPGAVAEEARAPLPAGDPRAWSVLVAGTSLEHVPWPGWGNTGWDAPITPGWRS